MANLSQMVKNLRNDGTLFSRTFNLPKYGAYFEGRNSNMSHLGTGYAESSVRPVEHIDRTTALTLWPKQVWLLTKNIHNQSVGSGT